MDEGRGAADQLKPAPLAGLGVLLAIAAALVFRFHGAEGLFIALDPGSAAGPCRAPDGSTLVFCDFANHYYPQGQVLGEAAVPITGFFYPPPFAILMQGFALFSYSTALTLWVVLGVLCALLLYGLPLLKLFDRSKPLAALYSALFITSLPVLHNFVWGQVSVPLSAMVLAALVLYPRRSAAALLAVAASVKLYPALGALQLLVRRDFKSLALFAGVAFTLLLALPLSLLGIEETFGYYRALEETLSDLGSGLANPYSNYIANSVTYLVSGQANPASALFTLIRVLGFGLIALNAAILYLLPKWKVEHEPFWVASFVFTMIPLAVGTCWIHYFTYLPLVQTFALMLVLQRPSRAIGLALIIPSMVLSNLGFFLAFANPGRFYLGHFPFWSSLLVLLVLYQQAYLRQRVSSSSR